MSVPAANQLLSANVSGIETDATGWTAGTNTTRARSTARFYQGAASLSLTATAAGSVSVVTATRVAVTVGTEYQAYAFFANAVAASGRTTAVSIDWYAASTGGSPLSTSTGTATTLPNATTWATPPPQVTAVAPAGAAFATITLTVTGLTAGAVVHADTIAFGVPSVWPGNLLPYNVAGVEGDATGWTAEPSATVTRTLTDCWEGWYGLQITGSGSGPATVGAALTTAIPVTPGAEYTAWSLVRASTSATASVAIRWYTSGGTLISTSTSETWTLAAATWDRAVGVAVAPPTAATARLVLVVPNTAGVTWIFDQMGLLPSQVAAGSLLTYAEQSFELLGLTWEAEAGCAVSRSAVHVFDGFAALRVAPTVTGTATASMTRRVPVTARQSYHFSPLIWHGDSAAPVQLDLIATWFDAADAVVSATSSRWTVGAGAGWYAPVHSGLAPDGATKAKLTLRFLGAAPGTDYYVDAVSFGPGGLAVLAEPMASGYGMEISVQGMADGTYTTWSLWRWRDDGSRDPVRGPDGDLSAVAITGDVATAQDYEAPLGVPVRYALQLSSPTNGRRQTTSLPATIDPPPTTHVVIKDPGSPARQGAFVAAELPQWTRTARQAAHTVRGRVRPVVISDVRSARTGTLTLATTTTAELDALWWVLETGSTLLMQWPAAWGERDVYVQVGDVTESRLVRYAEFEDRSWSLALTEVDRPVGGVAGSAGRTWDSVEAEHVDWADVLATYTSWLSVYTGTEG